MEKLEQLSGRKLRKFVVELDDRNIFGRYVKLYNPWLGESKFTSLTITES